MGGGRASQCFSHRDRPRWDRLAEPSDRDRPLVPARFRSARFLSELLHFSRTRRQRVSVVAFAKGSEGYPALVRRPCRRARRGGSSNEALLLFVTFLCCCCYCFCCRCKTVIVCCSALLCVVYVQTAWPPASPICKNAKYFRYFAFA